MLLFKVRDTLKWVRCLVKPRHSETNRDKPRHVSTVWRCRFLGGPLAGQVFETKWLSRWIRPHPHSEPYEYLSAVESTNPGEVHVLYRWTA